MGTATVDADDVGAGVGSGGGGAPAEPASLDLAAGFDTGDRQRWSDLVDGVMSRGRSAPPPGAGVRRLTRQSLDGIDVRPLYDAADTAGDPGLPGRAPYLRGATAHGTHGGWDVRVRLTDPDPESAARTAIAELETGANSLWVSTGAGGTAPADLETVLADVLLDLAPVVLDHVPDQPAAADHAAAAQAFLDLIDARGCTDPVGNLGLDPIGWLARTGDVVALESVVGPAMSAAAHPRLRALVVDATPVHDAGGSDAQMLGWSLAHGLAYLRVLTDGGLDLLTAARLLEFRYAASPDQFATIALFRAARRLWGRIGEVCGLAADAPGQAQHAVTSSLTWTRRDPFVNLLRGTVSAFAAGVGGAESVTVAPFDAALRPPASFSRRIARNTQSLLIAESHVAAVIDPAGGSWYVEARTDTLAEAGWAFFQELEAAGGAVAALESGRLAAELAPVAERRQRDVATRRTPLTGVSEFADPTETLLPGTGPAPAGGSGGLPRIRLAAPYEELRARSDDAVARDGVRPRVFLASLGSVSAHSARVQFARNLLQAGGIEAPDAGPTDDHAAVVAAFRSADTTVAVLCSSDALYAERGAATAAALREAGARLVLLAGTAADPPLEGVDGYVGAGGDALAALDRVWSALEPTARHPEVTT